LVRDYSIENGRRDRMKYRIGIWASVGLLVAGFWILFGLAIRPTGITSITPLFALVRLTCPIAFFSSHPLGLSWVLLANAATYALVGLTVETLRQQLRPAH
jgi:hypothetical protein